MDSEFVLFPPQASTLATKIDAVFFYILAVAVFFTVLIAVLLLTFAIKYRRRSNNEVPRPIEGSLRLEIVWTAIPLVLALSMFAWAASVYYEIVTPPPDKMEIYVVAQQWMWELQHAGGQREINELHIPLGKPVKLTMTSQDVIHSFFVPEFRVKQDVLPGRYTNLWFEATQAKTFNLFCAEYCGTNHSTMIGKVIVMEPTRFEKWLADHPDAGLAAKGRHLFYNLQCMTCHSGDAQGKAPRLQGLYGKTVTLDDGSEVTADEDYLRESIVNPRAKVVVPYRPIMPPYQLSEEKLTQLVVFLKSLRPDDPLPRYERREPPLVQPPDSK